MLSFRFVSSRRGVRPAASVLSAVFVGAFAGGCAGAVSTTGEDAERRGETLGQQASAIVDVNHTPVERQAIGNCWLYAQATWIESMHLTETGEAFDASQSYWTYWHWFDQVLGGWSDEISTGGNQWTANRIVADRGLVHDGDFIAADLDNEVSLAQSSALAFMNRELAEGGRLATSEARSDRALVREVMDEAWGLSDDVRAWMTAAFGADFRRTVRTMGVNASPVVAPAEFSVQYTQRVAERTETRSTTLDQALVQWTTASYPSWGSDADLAARRRETLRRVQRALHDRQPVIVTWNVDFNALESGPNERRGSFNLTTLANAGVPGRQGGHMTVLEDYEAETDAFGLLKAGVTLNPSNETNRAKLDAALEPSARIGFLRMKNSWGTQRADHGHSPGLPGYHDLAMDYANGPIAWCPDAENPTAETCLGTTVPLRSFLLPPGY